MSTEQAEVFGFPDPIIGVAGFAIVTTVGVALVAGARLQRWFWWGLQAGTTFGVVFIHWLMFQSLYRIDALCPFFFFLLAVTIPLFCYTTLHNATAVHLRVTPRILPIVVCPAAYPLFFITLSFLFIASLITLLFLYSCS